MSLLEQFCEHINAAEHYRHVRDIMAALGKSLSASDYSINELTGAFIGLQMHLAGVPFSAVAEAVRHIVRDADKGVAFAAMSVFVINGSQLVYMAANQQNAVECYAYDLHSLEPVNEMIKFPLHMMSWHIENASVVVKEFLDRSRVDGD